MAPSISTSITSTVASVTSAVSSIASVIPPANSISTTIAIVTFKETIVISVVMAVVFGMALYDIIFWFVAIADNNLCISSASERRIPCTIYIGMQIWSRFVDHYLVT